MQCTLKAVLGVRYINGVACPTCPDSHLYDDRSLSNFYHYYHPENVTIGDLYPDLDFLSLNSDILIRYSITHPDAPLPVAFLDG